MIAYREKDKMIIQHYWIYRKYICNDNDKVSTIIVFATILLFQGLAEVSGEGIVVALWLKCRLWPRS